MIIKEFDGLKYVSWDVNGAKSKSLREHTSFNQYIDDYFRMVAKSKVKSPQAAGNAHTAHIPPNYYNIIMNTLMPNLILAFEKIGIENPLDPRHNIKLKRCWINRMEYGSSGKIHNHAVKNPYGIKLYGVIYYYNIPKENCADLILIKRDTFNKSPKDSSGNMISTVDEVKEEDKLQINVSQDMCILHDVEIPHGISFHYNQIPREVIVLEFIYRNYEKL